MPNIFQNRRILLNRNVGSSYDPDAQAYFTAASITDTSFKTAWNTFVLAGKLDGWYSKLLAAYPFPGGSALQNSFNAINPALFQMTWNGTITHTATGSTGNGSTGYGDTGFNQATHGADDDEHISIYSRSNVDANIHDCTLINGGGGGTIFMAKFGGNFTSSSQDTTGGTSATAVSDSLGYFSLNRTSSAGYRKRQNTTNTNVTQSGNQAPVSLNFPIMCRNSNGAFGRFSTRQYAWFAIGRGLTELEDAALYAALQTFQTAFGRNV